MGKEIINATRIFYDGIYFQSLLEVHMYKLLKKYNFSFLYEGEEVVLIPSFVYNNQTVSKAIYTPDFTFRMHGYWIIIETKGRKNDSWPIREKLFKKALVDNNLQESTLFFMPRSKKDCDNLILHLLAFKANKTPITWQPINKVADKKQLMKKVHGTTRKKNKIVLRK